MHQSDLVSFVPMSDLGIREKFFSSMEEKPFGKVSGSYTYFADDDVLLAKITPCFENGKLGIARGLVNGVGFGSSEFIVFRPSGELASEFLFYYLSQDGFRDAGQRVMSGAVGHKRVSKEFIENHLIPLPPLAEQKRMVAILDEAFEGIDAAIANTEKNLANARELFDSYLNNVIEKLSLSCPEVGVDEACESIIDCVNKTAPKVDYPTLYKMIRTTNVRNGQVNLSSVKYVEEAVYLQWTRRQIPRRGDVILTREAPMGEVGILDSDEKIFLGQRLVSYRADPEKLNNRFLLYCFLSDFIQHQIQRLGSGSTVLHMRVPDSKKLRIPLPSLGVQREVVVTLDLLNNEACRLASISERKIAALNELKQSLLQKAFSGALTSEMPDKQQKEAVA
ncbi:restriction endonuclease subunit S [Marinobacter sp. M3C]|uniref:restriction endonuclease subunit S n=1 Tax=Marinobacter sp. M3C TaxID=2917715 RepID=UPI00200E89B9|nr:restriction endonuclease subunit S [Marinobacter sp. M3C]UQG61529.1 restriction endonuclease subunit S [Marinobacter sp. M3C]